MRWGGTTPDKNNVAQACILFGPFFTLLRPCLSGTRLLEPGRKWTFGHQSGKVSVPVGARPSQVGHQAHTTFEVNWAENPPYTVKAKFFAKLAHFA